MRIALLTCGMDASSEHVLPPAGGSQSYSHFYKTGLVRITFPRVPSSYKLR